MNRQQFLTRLAGVAAVSALSVPRWASGQASARAAWPMTLDLNGGAIGVNANQPELIALAARHGFESVEARPGDLARLDPAQMAELRDHLERAGLVWGAAGLPVDFRGTEDAFQAGLRALPDQMAGLQRAGVRRVGTWLMPGHDELTYRANFAQHERRLREIGMVLRDHDLRLGLEFVASWHIRLSRKYPFVHTLAETLELIEATGLENLGVILDSWHCWMSGDTADDIRSLRPEQVVAVDLNDAPAGREKVDQRDNQRELPATTGVIDVSSFLGALRDIGYDGPARAEPFNRPLNDLDNDAACAATIQALRRARALVV